MKKAIMIAAIATALMCLMACAPGPNALANTSNARGYVPGFWYGLWNGIISPVTFIISLFNSRVQMYEVHNNGGWYNFGFILGISIISCRTATMWRRETTFRHCSKRLTRIGNICA